MSVITKPLDKALPVALAVIRDGRLSFGARGLYVYLSNLDVGMTPSIASCVTPEGTTRLASLLKELRAIGAIRYEPIRDLNGQLGGKTMVLVPPEEWAIDSLSSPELAAGQDPAAYDAWFRGKVQEALDDPRPSIPHKEVQTRFDEKKRVTREKIEAQRQNAQASGNSEDRGK